MDAQRLAVRDHPCRALNVEPECVETLGAEVIQIGDMLAEDHQAVARVRLVTDRM